MPLPSYIRCVQRKPYNNDVEIVDDIVVICGVTYKIVDADVKINDLVVIQSYPMYMGTWCHKAVFQVLEQNTPLLRRYNCLTLHSESKQFIQGYVTLASVVDMLVVRVEKEDSINGSE